MVKCLSNLVLHFSRFEYVVLQHHRWVLRSRVSLLSIRIYPCRKLRYPLWASSCVLFEMWVSSLSTPVSRLVLSTHSSESNSPSKRAAPTGLSIILRLPEAGVQPAVILLSLFCVWTHEGCHNLTCSLIAHLFASIWNVSKTFFWILYQKGGGWFFNQKRYIVLPSN